MTVSQQNQVEIYLKTYEGFRRKYPDDYDGRDNMDLYSKNMRFYFQRDIKGQAYMAGLTIIGNNNTYFFNLNSKNTFAEVIDWVCKKIDIVENNFENFYDNSV